MERWWTAHESIVRTWLRSDTDEASRAAWVDLKDRGDWGKATRLANQGQVSGADELRRAVWGAFLYQRGHIDAFKTVVEPHIKKWRARYPEPHLGVLDVGCGAGTTAFALDELFGGRSSLDYVGVDHNEPSLELCSRMFGASLDDVIEYDLVESLSDAIDVAIAQWQEIDRIYVTLSYLLCQTALTNLHADEIARAVTRLVAECGTVRLVISDAPLSWSKAPRLLEKLRRSEHVDVHEKSVTSRNYWLRFPAVDGQTFRSQQYKQVDGHYYLLHRRD